MGRPGARLAERWRSARSFVHALNNVGTIDARRRRGGPEGSSAASTWPRRRGSRSTSAAPRSPPRLGRLPRGRLRPSPTRGHRLLLPSSGSTVAALPVPTRAVARSTRDGGTRRSSRPRRRPLRRRGGSLARILALSCSGSFARAGAIPGGALLDEALGWPSRSRAAVRRAGRRRAGRGRVARRRPEVVADETEAFFARARARPGIARRARVAPARRPGSRGAAGGPPSRTRSSSPATAAAREAWTRSAARTTPRWRSGARRRGRRCATRSRSSSGSAPARRPRSSRDACASGAPRVPRGPRRTTRANPAA